MQSTAPTRRPILGGVLVIVGGVLAAIAGSMEWGKLKDSTGGSPLTIKGGPLMIALGVGLAVLGVLLILMSTKGLRVLFGILALLGGLFMGLVGIGALTNEAWATAAVDSLSDQLGVGLTDAERQTSIDQIVSSIKSGDITKEVNPTLYGLPIGALLAIVGSILGLATAGKGTRTSVPTASLGFPVAPGFPSAPPPPAGTVPPAPASPLPPEAVPPPAPPPMPEGGSTG
jgi:uncharacterized membrane protein YidH (DUF202 family)